MAKKFGKFLIGAALAAGAVAAVYWYKKNYMDPHNDNSDDFDDFDFMDDEELSDFSDYDDFDGFEEAKEDESERNYVPIKLTPEETAAAMEADTENSKKENSEEMEDELLDALAEETLESIQDL